MAKKSSSKSGGRDASPIANRRLHRQINVRPIRPLSVLSPLSFEPEAVRILEDRRVFKPDASVRPPASVQRSDTRLVADPFGTSLRRVSFANPPRVAICARRKIRREVLHALRIAGGSGFRKRRLNFWSGVGC